MSDTLFRQIISGQMPSLTNSDFADLKKIREKAFPGLSQSIAGGGTEYTHMAIWGSNTITFPESLTEYGSGWYSGISGRPSAVVYPTTLTVLNNLLCGNTSTTIQSPQITTISSYQCLKPPQDSTVYWNVGTCANGDSSHFICSASIPSGTFTTEVYVNIVLGNTVTNIPDYFLDTNIKCNDSFTIPSSVTTIGKKSLPKDLTSLTIPSSVSTIRGALKSTDANKLTTIRFEQPSGMTVSLPTAGSVNGMCYYKSSYNVTIYTDNATIKNYAWSTDNVTATFKHLDGTSW